MRLFPTIPAALAAVAFAAAAAAHEFKAGDLTIGHPYAVETAATAKSAAGYFTVTNAGTAPDRLVAVEAEGVKAEVHETTTDASGVARMAPVAGLDIPAGATVTLAPRGLHVMFTGLTAPWTAGNKVPATLVFETAGAVPVVFNVEARKPAGEAMPGMDHSQHGN